jgi:anaerobic magnesium-protoporphyrin IX monomethyl ester cyclase
MRVMLVSINKLKSYRPVLPIGMVVVGTQVREAGHDLRCVDLMFEEDNEAVVQAAVEEFGPEVIGISIRNVDSLNMLEPAIYTPLALEVVDWARELVADVTVVLGGAGFTTVPEELMDFVGADYGLLGFAEESMVELLRCLENGVSPEEIDGIVIPLSDGGHFRRDPAFEIDYRRVRPTDSSLYDPRYFEYSYETHDEIEKVPATIQTKKGCVLECIFCSNFLVDGTGVKFNDARKVADEVERLLEEGTESLEIVDGVFNLPLHYAISVLEQFVQRGIVLPWSCMINPGAVNGELVELMARTGCRQVEFGTDSGCDRVLATLKKNFRRRQVVEAHRLFRSAGIRTMHCLFIGSPGDDRESVFETFDLLDELVPAGSSESYAYWTFGLRICRGTTLYDVAVADGVIRGDERFLVPKYYVSSRVLGDDALLDAIQERVVANPNWYLWWGLPNISLRERIRVAQRENAEIERLVVDVLGRRDRRGKVLAR